MITWIRRLALVPLALLGAASIASCGETSSASSATPAVRHAAAEKVIAQAIGVNEQARSGKLDGVLKLEVKGIPRFSEPIEGTADGVWNLPAGASVPDLDIDVGVSMGSGILGGGIVVADGKSYIKLGSVGYKLPAAISDVLTAPAKEAKNGLTKTGAMFHINPQDWQRNAQVIGEETIAGEPTEKLTADVIPNLAFADLAQLVHFLSLIHVPQALGLPSEFTPKMQAALVRSVTDVKGEVWLGKDDHVLRKAHLTGAMQVAKRDRKLLLGARSGKLEVTLNLSEIGQVHEVRAPAELNPYANLELTLKALAEAQLPTR